VVVEDEGCGGHRPNPRIGFPISFTAPVQPMGSALHRIIVPTNGFFGFHMAYCNVTEIGSENFLLNIVYNGMV